MVTICTTSLTFNSSVFCPHSDFMCFVQISEQTAVISLYSINWLVFVTEMECVYCAVQTGSLNIIQVNLSFERVKLMDICSTYMSSTFQPVVLRGLCKMFVNYHFFHNSILSSLITCQDCCNCSIRKNLQIAYQTLFYWTRIQIVVCHLITPDNQIL